MTDLNVEGPAGDRRATAGLSRGVIPSALIALALAHVVATRLSWADIPLQTDTGMWAYMGGRLLDGAGLYRDLWDSKPPGIFYAFAVNEWLFGVGQDRSLLWMDALLTVAICALTWRVL